MFSQNAGPVFGLCSLRVKFVVVLSGIDIPYTVRYCCCNYCGITISLRYEQIPTKISFCIVKVIGFNLVIVVTLNIPA